MGMLDNSNFQEAYPLTRKDTFLLPIPETIVSKFSTQMEHSSDVLGDGDKVKVNLKAWKALQSTLKATFLWQIVKIIVCKFFNLYVIFWENFCNTAAEKNTCSVL